MLVSRLKARASVLLIHRKIMLTKLLEQEPDTSLYIPALDAIKDFIKTSTSSMTAVPKPLKFLRPHFDDLTKSYEEWSSGSEKVSEARD